MNTSSRLIIYVSAQTLRSLFNDSQYPDLIAQNKISKKVLRSKIMQESHLQGKNFPLGTKSEIIIYRDTRNGLYVKVHQYLLPDGTIGASGKPDPKSVLLNGIMYNLKSNSS